MDTHRISDQERLENVDPHEGNTPIPFAILLLASCLVIFAFLYLLLDHQALAPELGDQRTLADLIPRAAAAPANGSAAVDGAAVFAARCAACHQPTGAGLAGVFPPLAGSEWVTGKDEILAKIVLHGVTGALTVNGAPFNGAMPAFKDQLSDTEIAAVLSHLRSKWGNSAPPVAADVVTKARTETASRSGPWKGDADLAALE